VTAAEIATPCPLAAKPLNYLDAAGMKCLTAQQSPPDAQGAPLYCVALVALAGEDRKACGFSRYAERGQDLGQ